MKFLIITQYFPPEVGAAQTRLAATSSALQNLGHSVEVVTAIPNYPLGKPYPGYREKFYSKDHFQGAVIHRFWLWISQGKAAGRLAAYLTLMLTAMTGVFKVRRPDYVFVNSGPLFLGLTGFVYSKFFRVPMIFYVADLWPRSVEHLGALGAKKILLKAALTLEAWTYRRSAYVVAVTEGVKKILLEEKKLSPNKVLFLPNGVDVSIFYPRPVKTSLQDSLLKPGQKAFIYAGNHGYAHALEYVLGAAELLRARPEIVILLVGGGSEKTKLMEEAFRKKLTNVIFVDPVDPKELAEYIQMSYAGLIHVRLGPLALETRPAKMFPLMAMGKAIVFAGIGEGSKLLEEAQAGWVCAPENPHALKSAILTAVDQPEKARTLGENGRRFVTREMSFQNLVAEGLKPLF